MKKAEIGLIGLAVMGENLVMNMESKGFSVAVYNRSIDKVESFVNGRGKGKAITGCKSLAELVNILERPRKIMLMIRAGEAVDQMLEQLVPLLEVGDIVIDGGNSYFKDTVRREQELKAKGLFYIGTGVSGGEDGALNGPCLMPGGSREAWNAVEPVFTAVSAKVDGDTPCCAWIGESGAGHFVKMVHNGIEYGDMQLICEAYQLMRDGLGLDNEEIYEIFARWNETELDSYLMEISRDIVNFRNEQGEVVLEKILDVAGQKGTGKWTIEASLEESVPLTLISEAVFARCLAAMKQERVRAAKAYEKEYGRISEKKEEFDMLAEKDSYIDSAYRQLQIISQDEQMRMEYEAREKAMRDYNEMMYEADMRGEERGEKRATLRINKLIALLSQDKRYADLARSAADPVFQKQLMNEYGIK